MVKLSGGPIIVEGRCFWAEVQSRELSPAVQPQEKLRHYTITFQCEKISKGPNHKIVSTIAPITVLALHLHEADQVLVQYSLEEPDRNGQGQTLPEEEMRLIEAHLASMVEQALTHAGVKVVHCQIRSRCTGSNLVRDRDTLAASLTCRTV